MLSPELQISCEFVGVTKWKLAICGEFLRTNYKVMFCTTLCPLAWSSTVASEIKGFFTCCVDKTLSNLFASFGSFSMPFHSLLSALKRFLHDCVIVQTCSRGTACNFLHCFENPRREYEWADIDRPPPRFWQRKMANLFGYAPTFGDDFAERQEKPRTHRESTHDNDRGRHRDNRELAHDDDRRKDRHTRETVREDDQRRGRSDRDRK